jgi:hypothetical protein
VNLTVVATMLYHGSKLVSVESRLSGQLQVWITAAWRLNWTEIACCNL